MYGAQEEALEETLASIVGREEPLHEGVNHAELVDLLEKLEPKEAQWGPKVRVKRGELAVKNPGQ